MHSQKYPTIFTGVDERVTAFIRNDYPSPLPILQPYLCNTIPTVASLEVPQIG